MLIQKNTSECYMTGLKLLVQHRKHHWTAHMTSVMIQSDGNDETDGTSGVAGHTYTDEMTHR